MAIWSAVSTSTVYNRGKLAVWLFTEWWKLHLFVGYMFTDITELILNI